MSKRKDDTISALAGAVIGAILGLMFWGALLGPIRFQKGYKQAMAAVRIEAVQAGVAKWVPDDHGKTSFEWIVPEKKGGKKE